MEGLDWRLISGLGGWWVRADAEGKSVVEDVPGGDRKPRAELGNSADGNAGVKAS